MSPIFSQYLQIWHWSRMSKCQKCQEEELAGMACLSCPCSSTFATRTTAELNKEDLVLLDMMQLQNLCVNSNLASTGNRATLIDRLLPRFIVGPLPGPTMKCVCLVHHHPPTHHHPRHLAQRSNSALLTVPHPQTHTFSESS